MSLSPNHASKSFQVSRRSWLIASIFGSSVSGVGWTDDRAADSVWAEPPSGESNSLTATTAVERLVRSDSRVIRLKPISTDFDSTIVQAIAADPRGEFIAVAGDDHAIRIMDAGTLALKATLQGHSDLIQSLHFDARGNRLVSAGNDGLLIFWNRNAGFDVIQQMQGPPAWACVRFSPDGKEIAAVGFEDKVYIIGRGQASGQPQATCECTDLRAVDYRRDGKMLAVAGRSGDIHLFDRATNALLFDQQIHTGRIHQLRFAESSPVVISVGEDGFVVMFDTEVRQTISRIKVTSGKLFSVCILDRQHLAVAGSDNVIRVVNVVEGRSVEDLQGHTGSIATLASIGNVLFSGGYDTTLRRWELSGLQGQRERIAERDNPIDR